MNVLLVTTWGTACGIAEFGFYLKQAVEVADPGITIIPHTDLDPRSIPGAEYEILHLNYHRALHSRWTPEWVHHQRIAGRKVVISFHDTFGELPPDRLSTDLCALADAFIVHEPCQGLDKALYWRMGVPACRGHYLFGTRVSNTSEGFLFKAYDHQPVLGSIGFPFPWKNFEKLAEITGRLGWALVLLAPNATDDQVAEWQRLNPCSMIRRDFVPREEAISILAGCDATAFLFTCANSGQSASILQGIAARKPVIAFHTCRQMRSLLEDPVGAEALHWCETFDEVEWELRHLPIERAYTPIVALAEQDSWQKLGQKYAHLYRRLL